MSIVTRVSARLAPESSAFDLAIFRMTIAATLATSTSASVAASWAGLPPEVRVAPLGVGWLLPHLTITPERVVFVRAIMLLAALGALVGLFTRTSLAVLTIASAYVLLVPQLGGAVFHDHHLLWFAALLAASPAGDALSIDALLVRRRGQARPTAGRAHGLALRFVWLFVAAVFFFPGLHKLLTSGIAWILSDNLRNQLWWKWAQDPSLVPSVRIDRHPMLLHACAALTVAFELGFPLLLWRPATRALAVAAALVFHQATAYFMGIEFGVLYVCYVAFVPWEALVRRAAPFGARAGGSSRAEVPESAHAVHVVAAVGAALGIGIGIAGAAGTTQAYPFACYPTFASIARETMPALAVELEQDDGTIVPLERHAFREPGPRGWALEWRLAGAYDRYDPRRTEAYFREAAARPPLAHRAATARFVRVYVVELSVDPDRRGEEIRRGAMHRFALETR